MGCGASDGCKKDDRRKDQRIDYSMENCNVGEFDSLFKEVRDLLQVMEETRAGLRETVDDIKEMCEIDRLKSPTLDECIKVWMWSISANNGGSISKAGFNVLSSPPFFEVDCSGCTWEAWWINDYFTKFTKTAIEMPAKVADALVALGGLVQKVTELNPESALESSGLDIFDKAKAVVAIAGNVKKTTEGLARSKEIGQIVAEAAIQIKSLAENMKTWLVDVDKYGKQAYDKSLWRPSQIVRDIHPGPKKTPEELKAYEELVLRNKCACLKCMKEMEEQAKKDVKK